MVLASSPVTPLAAEWPSQLSSTNRRVSLTWHPRPCVIQSPASGASPPHLPCAQETAGTSFICPLANSCSATVSIRRLPLPPAPSRIPPGPPRCRAGVLLCVYSPVALGRGTPLQCRVWPAAQGGFAGETQGMGGVSPGAGKQREGRCSGGARASQAGKHL